MFDFKSPNWKWTKIDLGSFAAKDTANTVVFGGARDDGWEVRISASDDAMTGRRYVGVVFNTREAELARLSDDDAVSAFEAADTMTRLVTPRGDV